MGECSVDGQEVFRTKTSNIQVRVEKDTKTNNRLFICQGVGFTSLPTSQSSLVLREAQLVLRKE